jgi:hypothetical protein
MQWLFKISEGVVKASMDDYDVYKQIVLCDVPTDSIFLQQLGNTDLSFVNRDKHLLTEEGGDRRIRVSRECALELCPLTRKLGYKWDGETVEWLYQQSYHAIKALMSETRRRATAKLSNVGYYAQNRKIN